MSNRQISFSPPDISKAEIDEVCEALRSGWITTGPRTKLLERRLVYTGLRPGEKLYEEKLMVEEGLKKTANDLIYIGSPIPFNTDEFLGQMEWLMKVAYSNKDEEMRPCVEKVVNTYHPANVPASQLSKITAKA